MLLFLFFLLENRNLLSAATSKTSQTRNLFSCPFLPFFFLFVILFLSFCPSFFLGFSNIAQTGFFGHGAWVLLVCASFKYKESNSQAMTKVKTNKSRQRTTYWTRPVIVFSGLKFKLCQQIREKKSSAQGSAPISSSEFVLLSRQQKMSGVHSLDYTIITTNTY